MRLLPRCDIYVVCGEASGDAYGAAVVRALRAAHPDLTFAGMGGEALASAGVEIDHGIDGLAVMGLFPVLARLPMFIRLGRSVAACIRARAPRLVLTIDYPGFNLRLVRRLADLRCGGTRFVHLVAPQVWAWKPRRAKRIAFSVDRLLCFFPFEPPLFARFRDRGGCRADFVGHPLLDLMSDVPDTAPIRRELGLGAHDRLLLLAPGSRRREVALLLDAMHRAAELALPHLPSPGGRTVVAVSRVPELPLDLYRSRTHFPLIEGRYRLLCAAAHAGLITSGTATLEAALAGLPHLICYRTDAVTAKLGRRLLLTPHIGLPNIVAGHRLCPEIVQERCTPAVLASALVRRWSGPMRVAQQDGLRQLRTQLGAEGAIGRIVAALGDELAAHPRAERSAARSSTARSASARLRTDTSGSAPDQRDP